MTWKVIHSRAIGNSHLREEKPCQDYASFCTFLDGHLLLGVVADGASSAKHSDQGAEIAVKCTIQYLQQRLEISKFQCPIKDQETAKNFFIKLLETVKKELEKQANNNKYLVKDLACTLLVFIASPDWLAAMQVGDGLIVIRENNREYYELFFKPDKGEFINYTTFVTSSNAKTQMQVFFDNKIKLDFICAATDWCENIAVAQQKTWQPLTEFFKPLEDCVLTNEREIAETKIDTFLKSERVNKETDDDKTLLLCVFDDSQQLIKKPRKLIIHSKNQKKPIQNRFLIILVMNLVAIFVISILVYQLKQPVLTGYSIDSIDGRRIPITLNQKQDVWVLTPLNLLDKKNKTITVANEKLPSIYLVDVPSPKLLAQTPLGYLPAGTYRYYEAKNFDRFYPESPHRWVRLKMEH